MVQDVCGSESGMGDCMTLSLWSICQNRRAAQGLMRPQVRVA
jgi:hypothetical protein